MIIAMSLIIDFIKRLAAFLLIALIGFTVGYIVYYIGKYIGEISKDYILLIFNILAVNPDLRNAIISGLVGLIFAVVIAYLWAKS